ncbi:uncharacterized protein [Rutidosis leptorrhynchoides]|uniref:uncharacterized protein n=1 Tax=Rutidosis leptorrhynchoides TaxID=125765 RepID=UPI003A9A16FE
MLEKIGLPAKPSLRGNNWVLDASHCQGCSSQFTFINRKHHCRRCGGLFCGSCTKQRMYLRGQGESPVRICEPCKTLEEAARFEMRHGHKNKSRKGASKLVADDEDDVGSESVSSEKESLSSMQRATSSSHSNSEMDFDLESTTPEELRQRAVEEKKKYKVLKDAKKPEEALRAYKKGKELERQAESLEIELRKNRKKALLSTKTNENTNEKQPKPKDDLVSELKDLGWSDHDLIDADKKPITMTLEGELSTLLKEVSQNTNKPEKKSVSNDKSEVVAIKKKALAFKREGRLTEAKEELKRAKILEKQIEEQELLGNDEDDSDDEFASLIRDMDIDKQDVLAARNDRNHNFDFDHLLRMDDISNLDGNFDVTEEDMDDPEMSAALQSLGWTEDQDRDKDTVDKETLLSEIQSLKKEALNKKKAGNNPEALALLKKAKLLEADVGVSLNELPEKADLAPSKLDSDSKLPRKSKFAIQRELLALKKKALALRREGKGDEADQELMKCKALEQELEELENGPKVKPASLKPVDFSAPMDVDDEGEDVTDTDMNDPSYLSVLQNLGWQDEDDGKLELPAEVKETKQIVVSKKSVNEIQRELLALKRKAMTLRREGNTVEAEKVLESTKDLEAELAEIKASSNQEMNVANIVPEKTIVNEVVMAEKPQKHIKEEAFRSNTTIDEVFVHEKPQTQIKEEAFRSNSTIDEAFVHEKPQVNESNSVQQQILAHKRKAVSLKREGKLAEAKEELKQAKLLEKDNARVHDKNPESDAWDRTPVPSTSKVTTKKEETEVSPQPKLSSRERFKLQQESLGHKRQALKLRREGRHEEAEALFELAKNLESQLEAATEKPAGPVDDVSVEDLLDPQLLSALREAGIETSVAQSSPEKIDPVKTKPVVNKVQVDPVKAKQVVNKSETTELEEQIKAEKVKALQFKRAGKQAEALDALRRAKMLEKKLKS